MNVKRFLCALCALCLLALCPLTVAAANPGYDRVMDEDHLLTAREAQLLREKLDEISERQQFDVVVVTVYSLGDKTPMEFADDYYDYNGYGFGDEHDGALLLLSMEERDWWVSTCGFGITAITDAGLDYMSEEFLPYLSAGNYYNGFMCFADRCDDFVTRAKNGKPYDVEKPAYDDDNYDYDYDDDHVYYTPEREFPFTAMFGTLVLGVVVALIVCTVMKGKLKSVRPQAAANFYIRPGSMRVTQQYDRFLYRNVTRHARPKDNDSGHHSSGGGGGGSSVHTSSSGTSHGGGGGKF